MKKILLFVVVSLFITISLISGCKKELGHNNEKVGGGNGNGNSSINISISESKSNQDVNADKQAEASDNTNEENVVIRVDYLEVYINDVSIDYDEKNIESLGSLLDQKLNDVKSIDLLDAYNGDHDVTEYLKSYLELHDIDIVEEQ